MLNSTQLDVLINHHFILNPLVFITKCIKFRITPVCSDAPSLSLKVWFTSSSKLQYSIVGFRQQLSHKSNKVRFQCGLQLRRGLRGSNRPKKNGQAPLEKAQISIRGGIATNDALNTYLGPYPAPSAKTYIIRHVQMTNQGHLQQISLNCVDEVTHELPKWIQLNRLSYSST